MFLGFTSNLASNSLIIQNSKFFHSYNTSKVGLYPNKSTNVMPPIKTQKHSTRTCSIHLKLQRYLWTSTRLLWIYLSGTPCPSRWSVTGLHTVCGRVNCGGIICHLFITQAISLTLFIFQQDPGHVLIILNTDWQCCVTTTVLSNEKQKTSPSLFSVANVKTWTD